jgi:hypothetical protein
MTSLNDSPDASLLLSAAISMGAVIETAPPSWIGDRFSTQLLAGVDRVQSPEHKRYDFPEDTAAYRIDGVPVLLGLLDCETERSAIHDLVRKYRNQASITRSWLGVDAANLQLFLLGIRGTSRDALWRQFASEIETDDRVCRKLVWLPSQNPSEHDATAFLQRTFLARPWEHGNSTTLPRLDAMSEIGFPPGWSDIVENETLNSDDLVSALIAGIHKEASE